MNLGRFTHQLRGDAVSLSRRTALRGVGASLVAAVAARAFTTAAAQDATPSAAQEDSGLTTELLAVGNPSTAPDQALQLIRFTLEPGATTDPHRRPGARVGYVDQGIWGVTVVEGNVVLQPGGGDPSTDREVLAPGSEYLLEAGDGLFIDSGAVIASRSAGEESLVLWQAASSPADELTTESVPAGSPAATPAT